jgi:hypothetical protein
MMTSLLILVDGWPSHKVSQFTGMTEILDILVEAIKAALARTGRFKIFPSGGAT